jgi:hypothetical protein
LPQEPQESNSKTFTGNININVKVLNGMIQQKIESTYKEQLEKDRIKLEAYEKKQREQALLQKLEANKNNLNPIRVDIAPKLLDTNGQEIGVGVQKELYIPSGQNTIAKYSTEDMSKEISNFNPNGNMQDNIIQNQILNSGDTDTTEAIGTMKSIKKYKIQRQMSGYDLQMEFVKCRLSALYFIENYVSVPVSGGRVSMKESEQWNMTDKYKIIINLFQQHDSVLYIN